MTPLGDAWVRGNLDFAKPIHWSDTYTITGLTPDMPYSIGTTSSWVSSTGTVTIDAQAIGSTWSITSAPSWDTAFGLRQAYGDAVDNEVTAADAGPWVLPSGAPYDNFKVEAGYKREIQLPDGSTLRIDRKGNYRLLDRQARVTYQANRLRDWNRFVSASDILEEFVAFVGNVGVRRHQFMGLPIELFIRYLIIRAAETDGEPAPDIDLGHEVQKALPLPPVKPRCRFCGRFVPRLRELAYCSRTHLDRYLNGKGALALPA